MTKTLRFVLATGLAMALAAGAADADTRSGKRKKTLFEGLFGISSVKRADSDARKRRMFGRKWWDEQTSGGVRIISGQDFDGQRTRRNLDFDDDPEGDPGYGMGNLTYVADKTVPLAGLTFKAARPDALSAGLVFDALTAPDAGGMRTLPPIREAVAARYQASGFTPLWLDGGGLSARGRAVLAVLAQAGQEGLDSDAYRPAMLASFDSTPPADGAAMARLDVEITAAALLYARHASGGQFDPRRLSRYHDVTPAWQEPEAALRVLAFSPYPAEYLQGLNPRHPAYAAMRAALAELRAREGETAPAETIADGAIVKRGITDERIPAVRRRLAELGYPQALSPSGEPDVLDAELSIQLRLFQKEAGAKVSGMLGPQTVAALNADRAASNISKLLDNMERIRWLPKDLGARHVFVNQPAFEVRVMDAGRQVWKSRVIVGKPNTQTAVFHDRMETVVFNPSWGVPPSIIANEYLPKLRDDPAYLDRIGFRVVTPEGRVVSSDSIDWWNYGSKVPFGIQQPPGDDNALGELKFLFPNSHNIYMHDTPNRELFDKDMRAFSHGCVRVQNPREFAQVMLGWDAEAVDSNVDSKRSQTVKLPTHVPVHITYFTAWPDESGTIAYFSDIYGRDKAMETARSATVLAQR